MAINDYRPFPEEEDDSGNNVPEEKADNDSGSDIFFSETRAITQPNFWEALNLPRAGIITTGVASLVAVTFTFFSATFSSNTREIVENQNNEIVEDEAELIKELKAKLALAEQKQKIKEQLEAQKADAKTEIKSTPTKSAPQPEIEPKPTPIAKPAPIPEPVKVSPSPPVVTEPKPAPVVAAPPPERVIELNPPPQVITQAPAPQIQQPTPETPVETDPYEEWNQAANTGVYTANEVSPTTQQVSEEVSPSQGQPKVVAASYPAPGSEPYEPTTPEDVVKEVDFEREPQLQAAKPRQYDVGEGTSIKAKLQNPVVLRGRVNRVQKYPIKITKAVKSADGTELIPDNSRAIAKVVSATTSGNIWMNVESVVIPAGSGVMQRQLPYGSVLVLARDGNPLKAKIRYPRIAVPRQTTIAKASFETQKASSKSLKSPSRQTRLLALRKRLNANSRRLRQQVKRYPTLSLKKGTKLQLYVNRSFNL